MFIGAARPTVMRVPVIGVATTGGPTGAWKLAPAELILGVGVGLGRAPRPQSEPPTMVVVVVTCVGELCRVLATDSGLPAQLPLPLLFEFEFKWLVNGLIVVLTLVGAVPELVAADAAVATTAFGTRLRGAENALCKASASAFGTGDV
mmetsp:Transcript_33577/g.72783  ORF Transcript_33577/g.72783 Transcript_33577/m.72783 type:complete len:148 (-) Transcript_33577:657-1100(-)